MKTNYALIAILVVAFLFSAAAIGIKIGQGQNISESEAGLLAAVTAAVILALRLFQVEKRLAKLENQSMSGSVEDKYAE